MIIFYYKISDLLGNAQMLSMYRANSLINNGAEQTSDDNILSTGDETLLKKYLKAGSSLISQVLSGYTKDLVAIVDDVETTYEMTGEAFEFDVDYELPDDSDPETEETVGNCIVFRVNMPLSFNQSSVPAMDEAIKDTLENYMLYRTAKLRTLEFESFKDDYETSLGQIRSYLSKRTTGIKRNYRFP